MSETTPNTNSLNRPARPPLQRFNSLPRPLARPNIRPVGTLPRTSTTPASFDTQQVENQMQNMNLNGNASVMSNNPPQSPQSPAFAPGQSPRPLGYPNVIPSSPVNSSPYQQPFQSGTYGKPTIQTTPYQQPYQPAVHSPLQGPPPQSIQPAVNQVQPAMPPVMQSPYARPYQPGQPPIQPVPGTPTQPNTPTMGTPNPYPGTPTQQYQSGYQYPQAGQPGTPTQQYQPGTPTQQFGQSQFNQSPFQQQKHKIDPNQVPAPTTVHSVDQQQWRDTTYFSTSKTAPPLASTVCDMQDGGNAPPKFVRITTHCLPHNETLSNTTSIPLGIQFTPLDHAVPLLPYDPIRCMRCKGYLSSACTWIDGKFVCSLCDFANSPPDDFVYDPNRLECRLGAVEYLAPADYLTREPEPASYMFAIDVSAPAIGSGWTQVVCQNILKVIYGSEYQKSEAEWDQLIPPDPEEDDDGYPAGTPLSPNNTMGSPIHPTFSAPIPPSPGPKFAPTSSGPIPPSPGPFSPVSQPTFAYGTSTLPGTIGQSYPVAPTFPGIMSTTLPRRNTGTMRRRQAARDRLKKLRHPPHKGCGPLPPGTKIGIFTYDRDCHFYRMDPDSSMFEMLVVNDEEMFAPLAPEAFFVDPIASKSLIEKCLNAIPQLHSSPTINSALGHAVQAGNSMMKTKGGLFTIYAFSAPNYGPGLLAIRDDKQAGTDKERFLFEANSGDKFWKPLAQELAAGGTCVHLNLASRCDVATLAQITTLTGGQVRFYHQFEAVKDAYQMECDLASSLDRVFGYDALLRIRCSNGLRVGKYHGNFIINEHDVELAGLDARTTFGATLAYDDNLDEKYDSSFQLAMLYTTATGSRRIRVLTIAVPSSSIIGNVFRAGDVDSMVNHVLRVSAEQMSQVGNKTLRDHLMDVCVKLLASYRKNCASATAAGQLILPESFKLLPLYTLSMSRLRCFRADHSIDARYSMAERLKSAPVGETTVTVYPRMFCVTNLAAPADGRWILDEIRVSQERMDPTQAYLLENGFIMMLWLGQNIDPHFLQNVFGVASLDQIDVRQKKLLKFDNETSTNLSSLIDWIGKQRKIHFAIQVIRQGGDPFLEVEFNSYLVEDRAMVDPPASYVDYLIDCHRRIQSEAH